MMRVSLPLQSIVLALIVIIPGGGLLADTRATAFTAQIPPSVPVMMQVELAQFILPRPVQPKPPAPAPRPKPAPSAPSPPDPEISAWKLCSNNAEIAPCEAYLVVYPAGKWADPARQRKAVLVAALPPIPAPPPAGDKALEKTNWLSCKNNTVFGACEYYLRSYPKGRWVRDAQSKAGKINAEIEQQRIAQKETADWDNCAGNSLVGLCERFLTTYPKSKRVDAARERVIKLGSGAIPN